MCQVANENSPRLVSLNLIAHFTFSDPKEPESLKGPHMKCRCDKLPASRIRIIREMKKRKNRQSGSAEGYEVEGQSWRAVPRRPGGLMVSEDVSSPSVSLLDFSAATLMGIQIHNSLLAYATSESNFGKKWCFLCKIQWRGQEKDEIQSLKYIFQFLNG